MNIMRKLFYLFVFLFIGLLFAQSSMAQCNSKVEASTKVINVDSGEITVNISTNQAYVCKLNSISGKGIEPINSKRGNGNSTIIFSNIDTSKIYQIEVEFASEENKLCKRLQKNDLIFESR
jgi:hypothetical protein